MNSRGERTLKSLKHLTATCSPPLSDVASQGKFNIFHLLIYLWKLAYFSPIHPSVHPIIRLSIHLFMYPSIHIFLVFINLFHKHLLHTLYMLDADLSSEVSERKLMKHTLRQLTFTQRNRLAEVEK